MVSDENRNSLLEAIIFRPLHMRKYLDFSKAMFISDNVNNKSVDAISAGQNDAQSISSFFTYIIEKLKWEKLKEFYDDENVNFEKWITLKSMKVAFLSHTMISIITRSIVARNQQKNMNSFRNRNVSDGLGKCITKSIFSGAIMAANIGCMMIFITQFATWSEHFSLWTVPCATIFSCYSNNILPFFGCKAVTSIERWTNVRGIFITDNPWEERESELYKFMKEHRIRKKEKIIRVTSRSICDCIF
ncbi:Taste receptor type 2 member [Dirofilaria immitis]